MNLSCVVVSALLTLSALCRVLPSPHSHTAIDALSRTPLDGSFSSFQSSALPALAASDPASLKSTWDKAVCRGEKLHQACVHDKEQAVQFASPIDSPFDGTLQQELSEWGYVERHSEAAYFCRLYISIGAELEALGIDPRGSDEGGPNECFQFQHWDPLIKNDQGPIPVSDQQYEHGGRTYRVSEKTLQKNGC